MYKYFFLFLIFVSNVHYSQSYSIRNYSVDNGLQTQNVFGAAQDRKGEMWFATRVGITSYDGLNWKNYGVSQGLPPASYFQIKLDSSGTIWASPQYLTNSVAFFKNEKWGTIPKINIAGADSLWGTSFDIIYHNNKQILCIGTANGLFLYQEGIWKKLTKSEGLKDNFIISITASNTQLYVVTAKGLSVFDGEKFDNRFASVIPKDKKQLLAVTFEKIKGTNCIWFLGANWIASVTEGKFKVLTTDFDLHTFSKEEKVMFAVGGRGNIYFGNRYAKFYINKTTRKIYPLLQKNGFASNTATSVFVDRESNVWFTDTRGIDKMNNFSFRNYYESTGLQSNEVTAIVSPKNGEYVFGHNNGITILKKDVFRRISFLDMGSGVFTVQRVLDMSCDSKGNVWFAASHLGLGRLSVIGKLAWIKPPNGESFTSVLADDKGVIWATTNYAIYKVNGSALWLMKTGFPHFMGYRKIYSFNDGLLLFATISGVICYKNGKFSSLFDSKKAPLHSANVFSILKIRNNDYILGTEDGLYSLTDNKYSKIFTKNYKNAKPVYSLAKDKRGNIYIGGSDGMTVWETGGNTKEYNVSNGLAGREINRSAFVFDSNDNLWIGTDRGVSCFSEENANFNVPCPAIDLKTIELINGSTLPLTGNIYLSNNQNTFFINFCGVSFINEKAIEYKVKLEGFDKDWFYVSQAQLGKLRYTNLPFGEYRLAVMAKNQMGAWCEPVVSGLISIDKPFYYKWWFIVLSSIFELLVLYGIYKIFVLRIYNINLENLVNLKTTRLRESEQNLRIAYDELEKRVEERTIELAEANESLTEQANELKQLNAYKDKFFSIVAHDLKSPFQGLIGISTVLTEEYDTLSRDQIKHFLSVLKDAVKNVYGLIENLLQWSRLQTGRVPFEPEKLSLFEEVVYVKNLLSPNFSKKEITFENKVKENLLVFADKKMLHSILQNLGTNAIKFTPQNGTISVEAKEAGEFIEVAVKDTGVGILEEDLPKLFRIDKQYSTKGTDEEEGTGLGLSICKEMVVKHKGSIRAESEIGKGSSFFFTMPAAK